MNKVDKFTELCRSWRKGKEDHDLYKTCFIKLFFFTKGFFLNFPDADLVAEDIAQVTLTKFYEKSTKRGLANIYFSFKNPQSWVYHVAKNACITEIKKRNRRGDIEVDIDRYESKTAQNDGSLELEFHDKLLQMEKCLDNDRDFEILKLNRDGYSAKEISLRISKSGKIPIKSKTISNRMTIIKLKLTNCFKNGNL